MIRIGDKAPDFKLLASNSKEVSLSDYKGKNIILYFYPKDNTPGCSQEACDFRDGFEGIEESETVILGVSKDSIKSHNKFIEKYGLPFLLLSDEDVKVHELYDTWKLKKMYGKEYMGCERSTFVIDKDGVLVKEYRKVKVKGHVQEVLDFIKENL